MESNIPYLTGAMPLEVYERRAIDKLLEEGGNSIPESRRPYLERKIMRSILNLDEENGNQR